MVRRDDSIVDSLHGNRVADPYRCEAAAAADFPGKLKIGLRAYRAIACWPPAMTSPESLSATSPEHHVAAVRPPDPKDRRFLQRKIEEGVWRAGGWRTRTRRKRRNL